MAVNSVPESINGKTLAAHLLVLQECIATNGTGYLNKIKGAVKCSHLELTKLSLIYDLLSKTDEDSGRGLECIFTGETAPGVVYDLDNLPTELEINERLTTFITYTSQFCKDCIVTEDPAAVIPPATTYYLMSESGVEITLEDGGHINLQ